MPTIIRKVWQDGDTYFADLLIITGCCRHLYLATSNKDMSDIKVGPNLQEPDRLLADRLRRSWELLNEPTKE